MSQCHACLSDLCVTVFLYVYQVYIVVEHQVTAIRQFVKSTNEPLFKKKQQKKTYSCTPQVRVVGVSANIAGHWRPDSEYHADFKSGNIFLVRLILGLHSASKVLGVFLHFCYFRFQLLISSLVEKSWAEQYSCREFVLLLFGSGNYWRLRFTKWKNPQNFRGRVQTEDQTDKKNIKRFEISMIFWIRPPMSCYIGAYPYYSTSDVTKVLFFTSDKYWLLCGSTPRPGRELTTKRVASQRLTTEPWSLIEIFVYFWWFYSQMEIFRPLDALQTFERRSRSRSCVDYFTVSKRHTVLSVRRLFYSASFRFSTSGVD